MYPTLEPLGEIIFLEKFWCRRAMAGGSTGKSRIRYAQQQQGEEPSVWWEPKISVTQLNRYQPLSLWGKLQHFVSPLSVGDLVATWHPHRPGLICKRILGLPGDQVLLSREQAERFNLPPHQRMLVIPDGFMWLEGDNPVNSSDSRDYGPVPTELVIGRVLLRLWPIRKRAWFRRGEPPVLSHTYGAESTVLPAGYQGQTIVRSIQRQSTIRTKQ
jgi:inner membrane protease subunit 1